MTRMRKIVIILLLTFSFNSTNATVHLYDIKVLGVRIGSLTTSHSEAAAIIYYSLKSNVDVMLFMRIRISYSVRTFYTNDTLTESTILSNVNGKNYKSVIKWEKDHYMINCNTYNYSLVDSSRTAPILCSVAKMYFSKPGEKVEIFSENYAVFSPATHTTREKVMIVINKNKSLFYYNESNQLVKVEMFNKIKNFDVVRSD